MNHSSFCSCNIDNRNAEYKTQTRDLVYHALQKVPIFTFFDVSCSLLNGEEQVWSMQKGAYWSTRFIERKICSAFRDLHSCLQLHYDLQVPNQFNTQFHRFIWWSKTHGSRPVQQANDANRGIVRLAERFAVVRSPTQDRDLDSLWCDILSCVQTPLHASLLHGWALYPNPCDKNVASPELK